MKMKRFLLLPVLWCSLASAQVKIGDNPQNIGQASLLELESTDRVLVITRVTTPQMEAIAPSGGAMVYNTEEECLFYYNGQRWINLCEALGLSFTAEPIANDFPTIIINRPDEATVNFEVGQIRGSNIVDFSISGQDIQDNVINQNKLADASVGTDELQDNAVTAAKLGGDVAGTGLIQNAAGALEVDVTAISGNADIVSEDLVVGGAANALFGEVTLEIAPGSVGTPELADDAVTSVKIADGQVAAEDLADDAVTAEKLDASVAGAGLAQNAAGALEVDVSDIEGDGTLSSDATITLGGTPANSIFTDVVIGVNIPGLISENNGNALVTGGDGGLFAADDQTAAEVAYDDTQTALGTGTTQGAIEVLAAGVAADLDTDPVNELALTGSGAPGFVGANPGQTYVDLDSGQLFVWDGTAPWVPVGGSNAADNDPDPQNELQDLVFAGGIISLTGITNPTQIDLSGYDTNAADDFDGTWGSLAGIPAGFADNVDDNTQLSEAEVDAFVANNGFLTVENDGDDTNELITDFALNGTSLQIEEGVNVSPIVDLDPVFVTEDELAVFSIEDADPDPTNEIQDLNLTDNILTITNNATATPINLAPYLADDQTADFVGLTPLGNLESGDVQAALYELQGDIDLLTGTSGANLSTTDLVQAPGENRFYTLQDQDLVFIGTGGNIGIGNFGNPGLPALPDDKLDVDGQIRGRGGFAASQGTVGNPSYGFYTNGDTDTGMFRAGEDQIAFSVGGETALIISESVADGLEVVANGSLELTEQLIDENGNAGNPGDVLVATPTGTQWEAPTVRAWGKISGGNTLVKGSGISDITPDALAGNYIVSFAIPFEDANYAIQLTVQGDYRIWVENQTTDNCTIRIEDTAGVPGNAIFFITIID